MTFSCYELQTPLEITENKHATLVIENPIFYRNFIMDLLLQSQNCSSRFTISNGNIVLDASKEVEIITDIFNVSFDSKAIQNKINQLIFEEFNISDYTLAELLNKINEVGASIVSSLNFEVNYMPISDFNGILKLLGFYIETENLSLPEKIMEYIGFLNLYCGKKLFIILNLKSALTQEEFFEFVKLLRYKKINILLIENQKGEIVEENENVRIIDNDLCEI